LKDDAEPSHKEQTGDCPAGTGGCIGGDAATWPYKQQLGKKKPSVQDIIAKTLAKAKGMKESTAVATSSDIHQESTKTNKAKTTHKIGKAQKGSHTAQSKGPASRILLQINQNEKQKQKSAL